MEQNDQNNKVVSIVGYIFLGIGLLLFVLGVIFGLIPFMAIGGVAIQIGAILLWFFRKCAGTEPFGEEEVRKTPISYHADVSGSYDLKTGEGDVRVALLCGLLFLVIGLDLLIAAICIVLFSSYISFVPVVIGLMGIPFTVIGVKGLRAWRKAQKASSEDGRS